MQYIKKTNPTPSPLTSKQICYDAGLEKHSNPLIIDFSPLLNYKSRLIINQWGSGVKWTLETKYSTEQGRHLDDAIVPLSFVIAQEGGDQWFLNIPEVIRTLVLPYSSSAFPILYLTSHYVEAYELFTCHPTLFWVLLFTAKNKGMPEENFLGVIKKSRADIMHYCDLPTTKSAIKLLRKIEFKQFNATSFSLINGLFKLKHYARLNHCEHVNEKIIKIVCQHPALINTRLISHFDGSNERVFSTLHLINDTVHLADKLYVINIMRLIGQCRSYRELMAVHDTLVADIFSKEHSGEMSIIYSDPPHTG